MVFESSTTNTLIFSLNFKEEEISVLLLERKVLEDELVSDIL